MIDRKKMLRDVTLFMKKVEHDTIQIELKLKKLVVKAIERFISVFVEWVELDKEIEPEGDFWDRVMDKPKDLTDIKAISNIFYNANDPLYKYKKFEENPTIEQEIENRMITAYYTVVNLATIIQLFEEIDDHKLFDRKIREVEGSDLDGLLEFGTVRDPDRQYKYDDYEETSPLKRKRRMKCLEKQIEKLEAGQMVEDLTYKQKEKIFEKAMDDPDWEPRIIAKKGDVNLYEFELEGQTYRYYGKEKYDIDPTNIERC